MLHIKSIKHISDFKLWLFFDDGSSGEVDLENSLIGPVFEPLKDISVFSKVSVDPELETVAWPNGVNLAPEFLKERMQAEGKPFPPLAFSPKPPNPPYTSRPQESYDRDSVTPT